MEGIMKPQETREIFSRIWDALYELEDVRYDLKDVDAGAHEQLSKALDGVHDILIASESAQAAKYKRMLNSLK